MDSTKILLFSGTIALLVSVLTNAAFSSTGTSSNGQFASVSQALNIGKIRVGYIPYPPETLIKDPNSGELSGICHDVVEEIGKNIGLKIEWVEEVTYATMIEGLNAGRYDLVPCIWPNAARGRAADFTVPLFYSAVGAYTRVGDNRFHNVDSINNSNVTIATIDGETASLIAKNRFPNAKIFSLPQNSEVSQMPLAVKTRKADLALIPTDAAEDFLAHNPGSIQNIMPKKPLAVFGNALIIAQNREDFKSMLDTALGELINNGTVETIIKKYQKYPNDIYLVGKPYATP